MDVIAGAAFGIALWALIIFSIVKGFWTPARLLRLMVVGAIVAASRAAHIGDWEVWTTFGVIGFFIAELFAKGRIEPPREP